MFFGPIRKTRLAFRLLLWNHGTEFNELDRKRDLKVLYQVCVFRADRKKTIWLPWPLIGWDIFDFSSEQNSTKLDRKQDLNVLFQVCVFRPIGKNKMAALDSYWLRHFKLLLWNHWTEFNETWQKARSQRPLPNLCFLGRKGNKNGHPGRSIKKGGTLYSGACYVELWTSCYMRKLTRTLFYYLVIGSSVRLSVCPSVCPYFRPTYKQSAIFKVWMVIQFIFVSLWSRKIWVFI